MDQKYLIAINGLKILEIKIDITSNIFIKLIYIKHYFLIINR